jgi:putative hemolysin
MIYHMRTNPNEPGLQGVIRPVFFADPEMSAADLLRAFVEQHIHMAIVRNTDGSTLGLVTFEDVVEELVGELEDEFDRLPRMIHPLAKGTWMVGGGVPISEFQKVVNAELSNAGGTVSSWFAERLGRVPHAGESYREGNLEFVARRTRRGKVFEVAVTLKGEGPRPTGENTPNRP